MNHKQGSDRNQVFMFSLESSIASDSFVRVVDVFVASIDLKSFGFSHVECQEEGRPPYHPAVLMKLYLYFYHHCIRTSRKLEREAQTNIEFMCLLTGLRPRYKTISDFRKNHCQSFREVFCRFVYLLKQWHLVEGETIAIDSFKIRANNSLKNNFNEKKLKAHLEYIDARIKEYEDILDACDKEEDRKQIETRLSERKEKRCKYQKTQNDLSVSKEEQIFLTDSDSRAVILTRNIVNVGYNIQASSDAKHKFLLEYDRGSVNDFHSLGPMAIQTRYLLRLDNINVLADKGYHTGEQLKQCHENGITTFVSPKAPATKDIGLYSNSEFIYDSGKNVYNCPSGNQMHTNGTWHHHSNNGKGNYPYHFQRYTTPECRGCTERPLCTKSKTNGRYIDRSEYAEIIDANAQRVIANPQYYRDRQQITEHQFGTLKRQRGFTHTNIRGKDNVLGEVGILFIGYNLPGCVSILGVEGLIKALRERCLPVLSVKIRFVLSQFTAFLFPEFKIAILKNRSFLLPEESGKCVYACI